MKLWLSKTSEVPLQEQLCTQFILGIISADLAPGERFPSTSQVARRFDIHANTVRSAYRDLVRRGWAEWRAGSGFFVRASAPKPLDANVDLDQLIAAVFEKARNSGYSASEVQARVGRWLSLQSPEHVLVIEPDVELRAILVAEIQEVVGERVAGVSVDECSKAAINSGVLCVALYDHVKDLQTVLPAEVPRLALHSSSIPKRLAQESRPAPDALMIVISRWQVFLQMARTTLVALGFDPAALDFRHAKREEWKRGLTNHDFIITDAVIARELPVDFRPHVFRLIAEESIAEIRSRIPIADSGRKM